MSESEHKAYDPKVGVNNPSLYRELSVPFAGPEQADAALSAFYTELYELRVKHRVQDVLIVVQASVKYPDEDEGEVCSCVHFGKDDNAENLAAYALGYLGAQRQERTAKMLSRAGKSVRKHDNRK